MADKKSGSSRVNCRILLHDSKSRKTFLDFLNKVDNWGLNYMDDDDFEIYSSHQPSSSNNNDERFKFFCCSPESQRFDFRFTENEIRRLAKLLFNEHQFEDWINSHGLKVDPVIALTIVCFRLASQTLISDVCLLTGHSQYWGREVFNLTIRYLSNRFERLLYWDYIRLSPEKLAEFAKAIEQSGAGRKDIVGFIDCTLRKTCRPEPAILYQEQEYSEEKMSHDANYQGIVTPDGLLVHLYGPTVAQTDDLPLYETSHIADALRQVAQAPDKTQYKIYGYRGYKKLADDVVEAELGRRRRRRRSINEQEFDSTEPIEHTAVEWAWDQINREFSFTRYVSYLDFGVTSIGCQYWVSVLLTNCLLCIRGTSKASIKYQVDLPSVEEYLASVDQLNEEQKFDEFLIRGYFETLN